MASTNGDLEEIVALTRQERKFIIQALQTLRLRGRPDALRSAIMLIDELCSKLSVNLEESRDGEG